MEVINDITTVEGRFYEVKNTLLPKTAPKAERFQWFHKNIPLTIVRVDGSKRYFSNGLVLDLETKTVIE